MILLNFKSIRTRLLFWFFLLSLFPLVTALVVTYFQRIQVIEADTFNKLTAIRDLKVERLNDWLGERIGDMKTLAIDNDLVNLEHLIHKKNFNQNDEKQFEDIRDHLNHYLSNYPVYLDIFIINPINGNIIVSTKHYLEGENRSMAKYFTETMESRKITIQDVHYSATLREYTMAYSVPIFGSGQYNKEIVGILVSQVDLNNSLFKMLLEREGLGETGETLIVNKNVLALNELRWYEDAPLNLQITAEPSVNASRGENGIITTKDYRGVDVLSAYTYIPEMGWGFVCKQDMKEINSPIREMIMNFVILFIISAIAILFIALIISKSISKPIVAMNKVAQKIGSGDFSVRNSISLRDEVGSLAREFNNMADIIESRIKINKSIADISRTMIGKSNIQDFGISLLKRLMKITEANMSTFYILNEVTNQYEHFASVGANEEMFSPFNAENPQGEFGNVLSTKNIFHLRNIPPDTVFKFKTVAGETIPKEIITIPIIAANNIVAIISLVNIRKFNIESYEILKQAWTNMNTSYSNLISNERTRVLAEHLSKTNQQLETQSEELQNQAEELQEQTAELQETFEILQNQNIELEAQRIKVEAANKLKSEFLSNMSHELRTPLNSIMALSRVLIMQAKDKLTSEENNYLEIVERNGKHLLKLINDILDLSKIESGKMDIIPKTISIDLLMHLIKDNMHTLSEQKGLILTLILPDDLPKVETDESRLYQVLLNIVGNAVKFTEKGGVDISIRNNYKNVYIEVQDSGVGISKEDLPFIFDEFRQADGSSSRQHEGTGLGLAIAKKLIELLGGKIEVISTLGVGTTFTITIPIRWHDNNIHIHSKPKSRSLKSNILSANKNKQAVNLSKSRILIVEDNSDNMITINAILKGKFKISKASDGETGVRLAQSGLPDLILLDVSLPRLNGKEIINILKTNKITAKIPVIAVTAHAMKGDKENFLNSGCDGYVPKPIDHFELLKEIDRLLSRKVG